MTVHTRQSELPACRARYPSSGKQAIDTRNAGKLKINTFLGPKRRMIFPSSIIWRETLTMPYIPKVRPIVYGVKPRPPCSNDVDHISGRSTCKEMSQKDRMPTFMMTMNTRGLRRARKEGGRGISDSVNESPQHRSACSIEQ